MLPGMCDRQPWKAKDLGAMARDETAPGMVLGEKWHGLEELIEQKIRRQIGLVDRHEAGSISRSRHALEIIIAPVAIAVRRIGFMPIVMVGT
jgi:hypothetical protein